MKNFLISFFFMMFTIICSITLLTLQIVFWPSNILNEELIKQFELYYNSPVIMDISINCDNKSNNILGYLEEFQKEELIQKHQQNLVLLIQ